MKPLITFLLISMVVSCHSPSGDHARWVEHKQDSLDQEYDALFYQERELNLELHTITDKTQCIANLLHQINLHQDMIHNREQALKLMPVQKSTYYLREQTIKRISDHQEMISTLNAGIDAALKILPDKN